MSSGTPAATREGADLRAIATVLVLGVLALVLRLYEGGDKSIWLDEAWSWRAANLSIPDMIDWTAQDRHPPLYYALLRAWVVAFGNEEWSLRAPSAIAGALSVAVLAAISWRTAGWTLGVVAGLLFAVHPTALEFSQEARMYPLAGLLALGASVSLAACVERPAGWRFVLYAVLLVALVYTHYSGFFVLCVHAALLVAYGLHAIRAGRGARLLAGGGPAVVLVLIAYIPWYPNLIDSARSGVDHLPDTSWALVDVVCSSQFGLQHAEDFWLAIALPLAGLGLWSAVKRASDPYVTCVVALALVPVAQLVFSFVRTPVLDPRQASPFIAGAVLVMALGLVELGNYVADMFSRKSLALPVSGAAVAALAVLLFVGSADWYNRGPREDWRGAAGQIEVVDGTVYAWRGYIDVPLRYYTVHDVIARPPGDARLLVPADVSAALILSHETTDERAALLREYAVAYVVGPAQEYAGITIYPLTPRAVSVP